MSLSDSPSKCQRLDTAETSRPARALKKQIKDKTRKPQGPKVKTVPRPAKYTNWFTPFAWATIKAATREVGNWSASEIASTLQRRHPETFESISRTTINDWIDRSGPVPKWKQSVLDRANDGNNPQYNINGRAGVLVSCRPCLQSNIKLTFVDTISRYFQTDQRPLTENSRWWGAGQRGDGSSDHACNHSSFAT